MNHLRKLAPLVLALASSSSCALYAGSLSGTGFAFPIAETTIEGQGLLGGLLSALGVVFPFDQVIPSRIYADRSVTEVRLQTIGLRLTRAGDRDGNGRMIPDRQKDRALVGPCEGSPVQNLDFLRAVDLYIQKNGSPTRTRIAHYCNSTTAGDCAPADQPATPATAVCGFFFAVDLDPATGEPIDLVPFLPDYTITTTARGTAPVEDVTLTGFVAVDWEAPAVEVPR